MGRSPSIAGKLKALYDCSLSQTLIKRWKIAGSVQNRDCDCSWLSLEVERNETKCRGHDTKVYDSDEHFTPRPFDLEPRRSRCDNSVWLSALTPACTRYPADS